MDNNCMHKERDRKISHLYDDIIYALTYNSVFSSGSKEAGEIERDLGRTQRVKAYKHFHIRQGLKV